MKKNIFILLILFQMTAPVRAQSFEYIYSSPLDEQASDAAEDTAGNYYLVGCTATNWFDATTHNSIIIKLNVNGDTVKTTTITHSPGSLADLLFVVSISDSTFAAIGNAADSGDIYAKLWYVKFDTDLNILDQKVFGDTARSSWPIHLRKSLQNELLIAGYTFEQSVSKMMVYRLGLNGDSLQSFLIGDSLYNSMGYDILDLPDSSGYLIIGMNSQNLQYPSKIVRTDNNGIIDTVFYIQTGILTKSLAWLSDSTFLLADADIIGFQTHHSLSYNLYDLNFNTLADTMINSMNMDETPAFKGIDVVIPGNVYSGGAINWLGVLYQPYQAYYNAIKFNNNLEVQWNKIISHNDDDLNLWGVKATKDGGVLLFGTRYNVLTSGPNERDIYVVKLDSLGNLSTGISNPAAATQLHDVIIYPNPATDMLNIRSTLSFPVSEIILYDASGREIMEKKIFMNASFSIKRLNAGIYFYKLKDVKGNEMRGKLVKE